MYQSIYKCIYVSMYKCNNVSMYQFQRQKNTHIKIYYIIEEMSCQHYQPAYYYLHKFVWLISATESYAEA